MQQPHTPDSEDIPFKGLSFCLNALISKEKKDLLANFAASEEDLVEFDKDLQKFKEKEIGFYHLVLSKLSEYVGKKTENTPIYVFFDIDETIAHRDMEGKERMRPSLPFLLSALKQQYPTIHFALCSSRSPEAIQDCIKEHSEYGFELGYSSRALSSDPLDDAWGKNLSMGHYNKARAMIDITDKYPSALCVLVDDIIGTPFEEKKIGIPISSDIAFYGYPEARWLE